MNPKKFAISIGMLLFLVSSPPCFADGRLFFSNASTHRVFGAGVDKNGLFHKSFDMDIVYASDTVIPTPLGFILYDSVRGSAKVYFMDGNGYVTDPGAGNVMSEQWRIILSVGLYTFFYFPANSPSVGTIVASWPDGSLRPTFTTSAFSSWSMIGQTNNYLLFYNKANGVSVIGSITPNGGFYQNSTAGTLRTGYTNFASIGENVLLWNASNGLWESGAITYTGRASDTRYSASTVAATDTLGIRGYNLSVETNGRLMLYNSTTGATIVGRFIQPLQAGGAPGTFVKVRSFTLTKNFTNLLPCGDFVVFYNRSSGQAQVGYVGFDGAYRATQNLNLGGGFAVAADHK